MYTTAIILAAGQGKRMNSDRNKQFLEVLGKPVIAYTIEEFVINEYVDDIIVVVNENEVELVREKIIKVYFEDREHKISLAIGGKERYNSVDNALKHICKETTYVLIHDGARPLVSQSEINDSINILKTEKAATLGVKAKNTYKIVDDEYYVSQTIPREYLYSILTPQSFHKDIIVMAYGKGMGLLENITDDSMMVEKALGIPVKIIEGSYENIKITTVEDLAIMAKILEGKINS